MIEEAIGILKEKKDLPAYLMRSVMERILQGSFDTEAIAKFLLLLEEKGVTVEELTQAAAIMRSYVEKLDVWERDLLDTCGTGGDGLSTFNISTISALVVTGAGIKVAKHGNRSVSSRCGSADLLEALGVNINMSKETVKKCLAEVGIAFLFAPNWHPAMRHVMPARRQLARKTIFNILGPLVNPCQVKFQLVGVYDKRWLLPLAEVFRNLGSQRVLVVHGADGLDEVTLTDRTFMVELDKGRIIEYEVVPEEFGFSRVSLKDLQAAGLAENIRITKEVLNGAKGSYREVVILNSACAIYAAGKVSSIKEGLKLAEESLDSGRALEKLNQLVACSQQ